MKIYNIILPHLLESELKNVEGFTMDLGRGFVQGSGQRYINEDTIFKEMADLSNNISISKIGRFEETIMFWSSFSYDNDKYALLLYDDVELLDRIPLYNTIKENINKQQYKKLSIHESIDKLINLVIDITDNKYENVVKKEIEIKRNSFYKKTEV